jgi:hypothetical protein
LLLTGMLHTTKRIISHKNTKIMSNMRFKDG